MKILVTGAAGQLGNAIREASMKSSNEFLFTDICQCDDVLSLDITKAKDVAEFIKEYSIDLIINCVAYTDVDKAEDEVEQAELLNSKAPEILAKISLEQDITLVHISTDYVFDGEGDRPYKEDSLAFPKTVYGRTKLAGEQAVINSGCKYLIFRTAWLYGTSGKNFVKTILRLLNEKPLIKVVNDQFGSPTYAGDIADALVKIIDKGLFNTGLYHYTNEGICSWYEFAKAIADISGSQTPVYACTTDEFPSKARRPHYSVLDKTKFKSTFKIEIPHWEVSLRRHLVTI